MPYPPTSKPYNNPCTFDEILSTKTFDLKKVVSSGEYKLCIVPTYSQIIANNPSAKAVIPEVLNYLRYTAAIRALEHNCKFIHRAINAKTSQDFDSLITLNYDYKNGKVYPGIRASSKHCLISPNGIHKVSLQLLEESKQYIQNFEEFLMIDKLSEIIPDFDKKLEISTRYKEQYIEHANRLIAQISNNKDIFNNFIDHISFVLGYIDNPNKSNNLK